MALEVSKEINIKMKSELIEFTVWGVFVLQLAGFPCISTLNTDLIET
jgi:hypothetical protein